jgi:hypothetical protein
MRARRIVKLTISFRVGDRIQMRERPHWNGEVCAIEAHLSYDAPLLLYRVRMDTRQHVSRYLTESDMVLLGESKGFTI